MTECNSMCTSEPMDYIHETHQDMDTEHDHDVRGDLHNHPDGLSLHPRTRRGLPPTLALSLRRRNHTGPAILRKSSEVTRRRHVVKYSLGTRRWVKKNRTAAVLLFSVRKCHRGPVCLRPLKKSRTPLTARLPSICKMVTRSMTRKALMDAVRRSVLEEIKSGAIKDSTQVASQAAGMSTGGRAVMDQDSNLTINQDLGLNDGDHHGETSKKVSENVHHREDGPDVIDQMQSGNDNVEINVHDMTQTENNELIDQQGE